VCRWWYSSFRWHRWGMAVRDPDRWGLSFLLGPAGVGRLRRPTLFYGEDCVPIVRDECFRKNSAYLWSTFWVLSCVNSNTWHLICNNFNLNFIYGTVCLYVCVFAHSRFVENLPIWSWETNPLFWDGSITNMDLQNKWQKWEYYRQVNHVAVEGPITRIKWSHIPLIFTEADIKLIFFPHTDDWRIEPVGVTPLVLIEVISPNPSH
jgi:hypothetical protein